MAQSKKHQRKPRKQVGVLPFRHEADGTVSIYLITSRETRRWIIPKGWPMKGRSASEAAQQEAYEEAGLKGKADKTLLGSYGYDKRMANGGLVPCMVLVFAMRVEGQLDDWPEKDEREGRWFAPADASAAVQEDGLAALILGFAAGNAIDTAEPPPAPKGAGAAGSGKAAARSSGGKKKAAGGTGAEPAAPTKGTAGMEANPAPAVAAAPVVSGIAEQQDGGIAGKTGDKAGNSASADVSGGKTGSGKAAGKNGIGKADAGKADAGKTGQAKAASRKSAGTKSTDGGTASGKTGVASVEAGKTAADKAPAGKAAPRKSGKAKAAAKPAAGKSVAGKSVAGKAATGKAAGGKTPPRKAAKAVNGAPAAEQAGKGSQDAGSQDAGSDGGPAPGTQATPHAA